ncbi:WD40 repeat domain-containing serine/threonine protein kinase [Streptomyces sp. NBC_01003]|uniref:WD40 repeat domain-containing serine/threonine protein kinase n=1 Tax=Streptomyces sp. NBC_01003 TaxID=2903714 RepID=UPI003865640B
MEHIGGYTIEAKLGEGGMGTVYLAYSRSGRAVAVKVVKPELAADPAFRARFRIEVEAARAVGGVHTAPVDDADPDGEPPWLATAYVRGPTLSELLAADGPMDEPHLRQLGAALAEALAAIHACGLVHRDLKPGNIIMAEGGLRVIDFGIARAIGSTRLTATGAVFGTPGYLAPEQALNREVTGAADVFALGVVLVAAAGGAAWGEGPAMSLMLQAAHEPPNLTALPPGLREVAASCLAKDPMARPAPSLLLDLLAGPLPKEPGHKPDPPAPPPMPPGNPDHDPRPTPLAPTVPSGPACTLLRTLKAKRGGGRVTAMGFSPHGHSLAASYSRSGVRIWDPRTGAQLRLLSDRTDGPDRIHSVAFNPDGCTLATGGDGKVIRLWDPHAGTLRRQFTGHTGTIDSVVFNPDGGTLAIGTYAEARLSDARTGKGLTGLPGATGPVAFSPDGNTLATGDAEGRVLIWDPPTGRRPRHRLKTGKPSHISALAITPDGRTIAAAGNTFAEDGKVWVHVWDTHTGKRHHRLTGHTDNVSALAFSPDGRVLASGDNSGTVIVWDTHTGEQLLILTKQSEKVQAVAFSPDGGILAVDGYNLAVGCLDGSVRIWAIRTR